MSKYAKKGILFLMQCCICVYLCFVPPSCCRSQVWLFLSTILFLQPTNQPINQDKFLSQCKYACFYCNARPLTNTKQELTKWRLLLIHYAAIRNELMVYMLTYVMYLLIGFFSLCCFYVLLHSSLQKECFFLCSTAKVVGYLIVNILSFYTFYLVLCLGSSHLTDSYCVFVNLYNTCAFMV